MAEKSGTKSNGKKGLGGLWIAIIVLAALIACGTLIWAVLKLPLASRLLIKTSTPTVVSVETAAPSGETKAPTPVVPTATQVSAAVNCGQSGSILLLVTAVDTTEWDPPHSADFIRYVKVDFSGKSVTAVALPRDLWVQTPSLASNGIKAIRLGEAYFYSASNDVGSQHDQMVRATTLEAQILYDNFGIVPDYYLTLDGGSVKPLVDTLGGISITNPVQVTMQGITFPAGELALSGEQASLYSRWMDVGTEWDRLARQKIILLGVWQKLLEPATVTKIPSLIQQFSSSYATDLNAGLIANLTCMLGEVPADAVTFTSVGPDLVTSGPDNTMLPDTARIRQFLLDQLSD